MKQTYSLAGMLVIANLLSSCMAPAVQTAAGMLVIANKLSSNKASTTKSTELNQPERKVVATTLNELVSANSAEQYYEIGKRYEASANNDMAVVAYQKALKLDANHTDSMTALAVMYATQKKASLAIPLFEQVVKLSPTVKNYNNLGYAYYLNQQYTEASEVLNQALALDPSHEQARNNLALVHANITADVAANTQVEEVVTVSDQEALKQAFETNAVTSKSPALMPSQVMNVAAEEHSTPQAKPFVGLKAKHDSVYELRFAETKKASLSKQTQPNTPADQLVTQSVSNQPVLVGQSGGVSFTPSNIIERYLNPVPERYLAINHLYNLQVVNANGMKGIAKQISQHLVQLGAVDASIRDARTFNVAKTQIQYRPGHKAEAVALKKMFKLNPPVYVNPLLPDYVEVKLVLGRDIS